LTIAKKQIFFEGETLLGLFCYWKSANLAKIVIFTSLDSTGINKRKKYIAETERVIEDN
jgi:hypothetical protein